MPTLKEYDVKLTRLRSTRKMTKTMQLVSANKLRRAQEAQKNAGIYAERFNGILTRLAAAADPGSHPLLRAHRQVRNILVVVFTSDRGLCGGFNNNLIRKAASWCRQAAPTRHVEVSCSGRRGFAFFRNRADIRRYYEEAAARPVFAHARQIGADVQTAFLTGGADEVHLAYNAFKGVMSQTPVIERLLPLDPAALPAGTAPSDPERWLYEPVRPALLQALLPRLVNLRIFLAMLNTAAGEHGARMTAMDHATTNADSLIERLTLLRNRARQAHITTELIEIVAGAEALK
jgi:F-type H+-transporting ATPase subunit gamma